jgi:hypothetical protein
MPDSNNHVTEISGLVFSGQGDGKIYKNFLLSEKSFKLTLFRTLLGTTNIEHQTKSRKISLRDSNNFRINYFHCPYICEDHDNPNARIKKFCEAFLEGYKLSKFGEFFLNTKQRNIPFYRRLLSEIGYIFLYRDISPTNCFIHIYRAIEAICYALPIIVFTTKNQDYMGNFEALKKLFTSDQGTELKFFENYLKILKNLPNAEGYEFNINVISESSETAQAIENKFLYLCRNKSEIQFEYDENDKTLKFDVLNFYKFICTIRNRFFHFKTGERTDNFSLDQGIKNPEDIFRPINDVAINWLAIIISELLISECEVYPDKN